MTVSNDFTPIQRSAYDYLRDDWPVFALMPNAKKPATEHGFHDAITDPADIPTMFSNPRFNIGIPTGADTFDVADFDGPHALQIIGAVGLRKPRTRTVKSPHGLHAYIKHDDRFTNAARILTADRSYCDCEKLCGIDIRTTGGYITAPPSSVDGETYRVIDDAPIVAWPELAEMAVQGQSERRRAAPVTGETVIDGQRNVALASFLGKARRIGMEYGDLEAAALAWNAAHCSPPLPEDEVRRTVTSIARYAPAPVSDSFRPVSADDLRTVSAFSEVSEHRREPEPPLECVYQGFAGDYVRAVSHLTEAHPLAIQAQLLVAFGNMIGRGPHFTVSESPHYTNEYLMIVGPTASGGKGQSRGSALAPFQKNVDEDWRKHRIRSGLSSGEGIIHHVRDAVTKYRAPKKDEIAKGAHPDEGIPEIEDYGESDKRLMVWESEAAMGFQSMRRDGNTLSAILRSAWDGTPIQTLTRGNPISCAEPHISIAAHITPSELNRLVANSVEIANGLLNRFVMLYVKKARSLPYGGKLAETDLREFSERLAALADKARRVRYEIVFDEDARPLWETLYDILEDDSTGSEMFGNLTARHASHIRRFAMLYALLDGRDSIGLQHLAASAALWEYSLRSVEYIFGNEETNSLSPFQESILDFIGLNGGAVTRTAIANGPFKKRAKAEVIDQTRESLVKAGYIDVAPQGYGTPETWSLSDRHAETAETAEKGTAAAIRIELERHGFGNCAETVRKLDDEPANRGDESPPAPVESGEGDARQGKAPRKNEVMF